MTVNTFQRNTATAIDSTAGASLRKVVAMLEKIDDTGRTRSRGNHDALHQTFERLGISCSSGHGCLVLGFRRLPCRCTE